jgi:hypothetical protein
MVIYDGNAMATTIDATAVTRITGVQIGTINVWVQRGILPGISVGTKGLAREFDLDTVLHIAATATLVQLGFGAPFASMAAAAAKGGFEKPGAKLVIGSPRQNVYGLGATPPTIDYVEAKTSKKLNEFLDGLANGRPEAYTLVELDRLAKRVRKDFFEPDDVERTRRAHKSGSASEVDPVTMLADIERAFHALIKAHPELQDPLRGSGKKAQTDE